MFRFSPFRKNLDSLVAAAAGFFIIFMFTRHSGIGMCPDGVAFTTTAEHVVNKGQLRDFTGMPLVNFPAFYPLFLAAMMKLTGSGIMSFAPFLNAFLFAIIIYLAGNIMEQFRYRSKWYKAALLSCIVLSPGLLEDYSMLWAETLFVLFILLFLSAMLRYFQTNSRKALIAAAVITALACVTRYAGVTIIATGGLFILLNSTLTWKRRWIDLGIFALISPLLLVINLWRNYNVNGTLTGDRELSLTSFVQNSHDAGMVFSDWLPFLHENYNAAEWVTFLLLLGLAFLCLRYFFRDRGIKGYENMAAIFSLVYILFMIVTASLSRFETLNSRFMSPVFIPLLWCGSSWVLSVSQQSKAAKKGMFVAGALLFIAFQYNQLDADYETWDGVKDAGIPGYTEDQWTKSETVLFIQNDSLPFKKNYTIYSDAYDAIYYFTKRPGEFLPHKESKKEIQQFLNNPHCYLVWFNDGENTDLVDTTFVTHVKKMKLLKQFDDGVIYGFGE